MMAYTIKLTSLHKVIWEQTTGPRG